MCEGLDGKGETEGWKEDGYEGEGVLRNCGVVVVGFGFVNGDEGKRGE